MGDYSNVQQPWNNSHYPSRLECLRRVMGDLYNQCSRAFLLVMVVADRLQMLLNRLLLSEWNRLGTNNGQFEILEKFDIFDDALETYLLNCDCCYRPIATVYRCQRKTLHRGSPNWLVVIGVSHVLLLNAVVSLASTEMKTVFVNINFVKIVRCE